MTKKLTVTPLVTLLVLCATMFTACGPKKNVFSIATATKWNAEQGKSLVVEVVWAKHKGDAFDIFAKIANSYAEPVTLTGEAIQLSVNGSRTVRPHNVVQMSLSPNEERTMLLLFNFAGREFPKEVTAVLTIDEIYKGEPHKPENKMPSIKLTLPIKR